MELGQCKVHQEKYSDLKGAGGMEPIRPSHPIVLEIISSLRKGSNRYLQNAA